MTAIQTIITQNKRLELKDILYLVYQAHKDREEYMLLNYIEKKIIGSFGDKFLESSRDKIELVMQLLLNDTPEDLYDMYKGSFDVYMDQTGNKFENINSFNFIFMSYIHIALKTIKINTVNT